MDNGQQKDRDRSRRGDRPSRFSDASRDRSVDRKSDSTRIFISNIPYETRWSEIKDLFKEKVGDVAYVELINDENGKPRGCGIVEFSNPEACRKAMEVMFRTEINGRKLVMKEETGNERRHMRQSQNSRQQADDKEKGNFDWNRVEAEGDRFNTYGLSAQFLDSINVQPPLVKKVFVANLDYKADAAKIKEIFKLAGKVRNIDLCTDKDGKSRGFCVVEFDHPVEAVQAISMFDHQTLYDRRMTVRMDRAHKDKPLETRLPDGLKSIGLGLGSNGEPLRDVARNLPSNQPAQSNANTLNATNNVSSGILGAVPSAGVGLNGLGAGIGASGLGANNSLGSTALGLQALGLGGLSALQTQLLQSGLTGDLAGNIASALSAQQQLAQANLGVSSNLGNLGVSSNLGNLGSLGNLGNSAGLDRGLDRGNSNMGSGIGAGMGMSSGGSSGNVGRGNIGSMGPPQSNFGSRDTNQSNDRQHNSDMVVVSNLPPTMTWQILREKFSECGDVKFAEITSKDTAIVRFHKQWDADRAVKMFDHTRIDGRTIEVRFF